MSYDLTFWKQKPSCKASPSSIYGELLEGRVVEGLEVIPTAEFVARIHERFPGITTNGGMTFWEGGERGCLRFLSDQHVHFCCRQMSGDDMNIPIYVASAFQCPLYDPQEGKRFDGRLA